MCLVLSQALGMSCGQSMPTLREPALGSPCTKPLPEHPESWVCVGRPFAGRGTLTDFKLSTSSSKEEQQEQGNESGREPRVFAWNFIVGKGAPQLPKLLIPVTPTLALPGPQRGSTSLWGSASHFLG